MLEKYYKLQTDTGLNLDLMGHEGVFRKQLGNIMIVDDRLIIYDTLFYTTKGLGFLSPFIYPLFLLGRLLQNQIIKKYQQKLECYY